MMKTGIDISQLAPRGGITFDDLRGFWAESPTPLQVPCPPEQLSREWIIESSRIPWLNLDVPRFDYESMNNEALALHDKFVEHRADGNVGWKSLAIHGLSATATRSSANYGYNSERDAPYTWTDVAEICPVTRSFLERLPFRRLFRVRYMWLEPGGIIFPHIDTWHRELTALNIALSNPSSSYFKMRDHGCVPFQPGLGFLVDISNMHSCINMSEEPRIHIIVHFGDPLPEWDAIVCRSFERTWLAETPVESNPSRAVSHVRRSPGGVLKARVCEWIARHNTQATAFVVKHRGHTVATGATGKRAPENTSPSVQLDSVFRMSSVSKVVTASAAMALVEDGRLSLTRAVCDYLPEFSGSKETLVHNLLTHTSGLDTRDYEKLLGEVSCPTVQHTPRSRLQQMVAAACATHPRFDPGQWCLYGGINYVLLGEIIERCAGCDLNVFAKKRLFDPLDMSDSRYGIDDRLALRYVSLDPSIFRDVRPTYDPNDDFELRIPHPSGNLFSTAPDMSAFAQMFLNKGKHRQSDVLSPATVAAMTRNQIPGVFSKGPTPVLKNGSWGLGWIIQGDSQWKQ